MGRAERRKSGNKEKVKTYVMTEEQLIALVQRNVEEEMAKERVEIREKAVDEAFASLLSIPIIVLHDKFGFGEVRKNRFIEDVTRWIKLTQQDESTLRELIHVARDECGYVIKGYKYDYPIGGTNEH